MMIQANSIKKTFHCDAGPLEVLKGVSFSIQQAEMVALVGASGSGKTTLLQILGGLDRCTSGEVVVNSHRIDTMHTDDLCRFRNKSIGFVFQFHHLLPDFTAVENVFLPGLIKRQSRQSCIGRAQDLLALMGLENRKTHYPSQLSGGERQRVALARALFNEPALILADEPTGNLDSENSKLLLNYFHQTNEQLKQTFLIATHNEHLSQNMHRILSIEEGIVKPDYI